MNKLLNIKNLSIRFYIENNKIDVVDNISLYVNKKEKVGLVGESGCGKSVTALSILQLLPVPISEIFQGQINFKNIDLLNLNKKQIRKIRGNKISMIFQDPMTSLSPVHKIKRHLFETLEIHNPKMSKKDKLDSSIYWLKQVGIKNPENRINSYSFELSGGMIQRVMIAIALMNNPELLIADEPTTALDVTVQAQILELINKIHNKFDMSLLLISHDLAVVSEVCSKIIVMYAGKIVEIADNKTIFNNPLHPYTIGLIKSIPMINKKQDKLYTIPGQVPNPINFPKGCRFEPRCDKSMEICKHKTPELKEYNKNHFTACFRCEKKI